METQELTLSAVQRQLDSRHQKIALSWSGGQYNAYVFEGEKLVKCARGDDLPQAVERAITPQPGSRPPQDPGTDASDASHRR